MRDTTIQIVKATAPVLEQTATQITTRFYEIMLGEYPEVRPYFNKANQSSGRQSKALATAIIAFARFIETPEVLAGALKRIAHKHVSLNIQPAQYDIVGRCLLRAIGDVLVDAATDEVLDAWGEAYGFLANTLIEIEEEMYQAKEQARGGWRGPRRFRVARITRESSTIQSFYLKPADGGPLMPFQAGQYLTVLVDIDGETLRRNYSISSAPGLDYYRITIKREMLGAVSRYFHDQLQEGAEIDVLPPSGEMVLTDSERPLVLISGGVGITPTISMLDAAIETGRRIVFLHATRNGAEHAFREHVEALAKEHPQLRYAFIYAHPNRTDAPQHSGYISDPLLSYYLPRDRADMDVYFIGPKPFMETVYHCAKQLGVPADCLHFEFFGPHEQFSALPPETARTVASEWRRRRPESVSGSYAAL